MPPSNPISLRILNGVFWGIVVLAVFLAVVAGIGLFCHCVHDVFNYGWSAIR